MSKSAERTLLFLVVVIALATSLLAYQSFQRQRVPDTGTAYQSVALMNGQLFFGRLEASSGNTLTLRDVFYLQTRQNPQTQAVANVLVKRGGEAHGAEHMVMNREQVLLIEPVKADSQIGKLITEQEKGPAAGPR